jgi:hypothetical protein
LDIIKLEVLLLLLTSLLLLLISFVFSGFLFYEKRKMIFSNLPDEKK